MGLFYSKESKQQLLGYADARYLLDPHKAKSQIGYMATLLNHLEIIEIHEASRECIRLRSMIQHIQESCRFLSIKDNPTTLFEDYFEYIAHIKGGYIKKR